MNFDLAVGKVLDSKIIKNLEKRKGFVKLAESKITTANLRKAAGRSSSALQRQASKLLAKANYYRNVNRGVSSVLGSFISFWNIAR